MFWEYFTAGASGGASFGIVFVLSILLIVKISDL